MPISHLARNLRDGELTIKGAAGVSLTVLLDEGDLSWTERQRTLEIKDRGSIAQGHTRPGDEESVSLSFSAKWTQLIGKSANPADPLTLYETLTFAAGSGVASTSPAGEQRTLTFEFTVHDPAGLASEKIEFLKVYRESLTMSEGNETNLISFSGRAFITAPSISRI